MTRPKPRQKNRDPMAMLGVMPPPHTMQRIEALVAEGRIAEAQRIILDFLALEFDGPPFKVSMKPGQRRKIVSR